MLKSPHICTKRYTLANTKVARYATSVEQEAIERIIELLFLMFVLASRIEVLHQLLCYLYFVLLTPTTTNNHHHRNDYRWTQ